MSKRNTRELTAILGGVVAALCAGCTYQTVPVSAREAAIDSTPHAVRQASVALLAAFSDDELTSLPTRIGASCTAHHFPVSAAPALRKSLDALLASSFSRHENVEFVPTGTVDADFYLAVDVDRFETRLGYTPGVWTGSAHAESNVAITVVIYDRDGAPVIETMVSGDGSSIASGGCAAGSTALADATSEAIGESLDALSYRVFGSDEFKALITPADSLTVAESTAPDND